MKILILYAGYGDGHVQVSKALRYCFEASGSNQVLLLDLYARSHPLINELTRLVYLFSSKFCPQLYGWSYYLTRDNWTRHASFKIIDRFGLGALKNVIREEKPDAVINTFPMSVMPELRRRTDLQIPIYSVLTDFVLHDRWLHPEIDRYYVANEELKKAMMAKGIPAQSIKVSGIPIRREFCQPCQKDRLYARYGLKPASKTVLIMAGAYGILPNLDKICQALLSLEDIQLLLVCGKNKAAQKTIEARFPREANMHIFGFVEKVQELMAISACMITKAGGITLAEALALSLPVIVYRPLPGQERENALFLEQKGAAMIAGKPEELLAKVKQILDEKDSLARMEQALQELQTKNASETVVLDVLNQLNQ